MTATRDRVLLLAGYASCAAAVAMIVLLASQRGIGRDFAAYDLSAYVRAAGRLIAGEPLYPQLAADAFRLGQQDLYLYPPPVALAFVPALALPFSAVSVLWAAALIATASFVGLALARRVAPARRPLAVGLVLGWFPVQWELANGNLTLVTLALMLVGWRLRAYVWRAGSLLALAAGLKLLAVPLLGVAALAGRWRIVGASCIVLAAIAVLSLPVVGHEWDPWLRLSGQLAIGPESKGYNVVPEALRTTAGRVALGAITLAILVACGVVARRGGRAAEMAFAAAAAVAPFVSAFVWYAYAVLALPLLVLLILDEVPAWVRTAGITAWVLIALQALDPATAFPSALVGTFVAAGAGLTFATRLPRVESPA